MNKEGSYRVFASSLRAGESRLESRYVPKKDETWLWERAESLQEEGINEEEEEEESKENERIRPVKERLSGMVVPYLKSERGKMSIEY